MLKETQGLSTSVFSLILEFLWASQHRTLAFFPSWTLHVPTYWVNLSAHFTWKMSLETVGTLIFGATFNFWNSGDSQSNLSPLSWVIQPLAQQSLVFFCFFHRCQCYIHLQHLSMTCRSNRKEESFEVPCLGPSQYFHLHGPLFLVTQIDTLVIHRIQALSYLYQMVQW